jgi:hypothetical protein
LGVTAIIILELFYEGFDLLDLIPSLRDNRLEVFVSVSLLQTWELYVQFGNARLPLLLLNSPIYLLFATIMLTELPFWVHLKRPTLSMHRSIFFHLYRILVEEIWLDLRIHHIAVNLQFLLEPHHFQIIFVLPTVSVEISEIEVLRIHLYVNLLSVFDWFSVWG